MNEIERASALYDTAKDYAWPEVRNRVRFSIEFGTLSDLHETRGAVKMAYILSAINKEHKEQAEQVLFEALKGGEGSKHRALELMDSYKWRKEEENV